METIKRSGLRRLSLVGFVFLSVFSGRQCWAQIVNMGQLYVSSGTGVSLGPGFRNMAPGDFINDGISYVYGDFTNDGLVDFIDGVSEVRFIADVPQAIEGSVEGYTRFSNVHFDNVGGFLLGGEVRVSETAYFNRGVVDGEGGLLFEDGSGFIGGSDGSHVAARAIKSGNGSFEFPVGDGGYYRPAILSGHQGVSGSFGVSYHYEGPGDEYPLGSVGGAIDVVDSSEYWVVERLAGSGTVLLTLGWDEITTPPDILAGPLSDLHIVRWDEGLGQWVDEGGAVNEVEGTVTTTALENFGVFTLARIESGIIIGDESIYNLITPNGDGRNDYFMIDDLDKMPNNTVEIYNGMAQKVFETDDYDTTGNVFDGFSKSGLTLGGGNLLPVGTYYYVITYDYDNGTSVERLKKVGYLYLEE